MRVCVRESVCVLIISLDYVFVCFTSELIAVSVVTDV